MMKIRRLEHRVTRRTVTVRLVLPYVLEDGKELVVSGEGPTYDRACDDLERQLDEWRSALAFDHAGEELVG